MKNQYYRARSSRQLYPSLIFSMKIILLALAASAVPFLILYTLPSLTFFFFHTIPSLWSFSCAIFTPTHLFVFLNVIILSILAMSHLHIQPAGTSSLLPPPTASDEHSSHLRAELKLDDHEECADFQLVDEVDDTIEVDGAGGEDIQRLFDNGQEDEEIIHTGEVISEMILETHLEEQKSGMPIDQSEVLQEDQGVLQQLSAGDSIENELAAAAAVRRESEKAEEAEADHHPDTVQDQSISSLPGNDPPPAAFCFEEALLAAGAEGSIFTRVESRPLPSARFTHKKASKQLGAAGHDRPHSPHRISRPIVKRSGDTLEATWKAICESKRHSSPLQFRHYTKRLNSFEALFPSPLSPPILQSSKKLVFTSPSHHHPHDLTKPHAMSTTTTTTTRKPSIPQEELNAKVESFISRFNEQIRIQREKSLLDYMEMVGRGAS